MKKPKQRKNQSSVQFPFCKLIEQIKYKAKKNGIEIEIIKQETKNKVLNTDINGAINIIRKINEHRIK